MKQKNIMKKLPNKNPKVLNNISCVYCGSQKFNLTKEHVIGRRFIPKGKLHNQWNLIIQACRKCNEYKSKLEDDVSAITMQPNVIGVYADNDPLLKLEAERKGKKSLSKLTNKTIHESVHEMDLSIPIANKCKFNFKFKGPPQLDKNRALALAKCYVMAFFYFLTYDENQSVGRFWEGSFYGFSVSHREDWGNTIFCSFMEKVNKWKPRFLLITADGYFKAMIRKHPVNSCWCWGVEWNKSYRLIGCFGDKFTSENLADQLIIPESDNIWINKNKCINIREEVSLLKEQDSLFAL
jgi:hypothetical protein